MKLIDSNREFTLKAFDRVTLENLLYGSMTLKFKQA